MLSAGDELGHTQRGNNNAYCQDNEITWLNWDLNEEQKGFLEFVRTVIAHLGTSSRSSTGGGSSTAAPSAAPTSRTSPGSAPPARR